MSRPLSSASTSTDRLPFHQSRASRPDAPGGAPKPSAWRWAWTSMPGRRGGLVVARRHGVLDEPAEDVADARLAGLVADEPGQDPVLDRAAHAGHDLLGRAEDHVADRRAHDHDHPPRAGDRRRRDRDVGIDVADGHRRAGPQAGPRGRLLGQATGALADGSDVARQLGVDDVAQPRVERGEVVGVGEAVALRPHRLVAGGAGVAGLDPGEPPDDPVGRLDEAVGGGVRVGRLVEDLEDLGEEPLRRDLAAIAVEPGLAGRPGGVVDAVGLGLGGVVLPELDPGVRVGPPAPGPRTAACRRRGSAASCTPSRRCRRR